jgi:Co/Zn/Cd efflux system component
MLDSITTAIIAAFVFTLSTISLANLHTLFLQSTVAQLIEGEEKVQQPPKLTDVHNMHICTLESSIY